MGQMALSMLNGMLKSGGKFSDQLYMTAKVKVRSVIIGRSQFQNCQVTESGHFDRRRGSRGRGHHQGHSPPLSLHRQAHQNTHLHAGDISMTNTTSEAHVSL